MLGRTNAMNIGKAEGLYVWKKSKYTPAVTVENPQCSFSGSYGSKKVSISNANFNLSKIENYVDFFDGFEGANPSGSTTCRLYKSADSLIFNYGAQASTVTAFDPVSGKFTVAYEIKATTNANCSYTGTKNYSDEKKTLESFAVADDPNAYPNGAVHTDGYYYELLASVPSTNAMSLSDNALAAVQQDYRQQIITEVNT